MWGRGHYHGDPTFNVHPRPIFRTDQGCQLEASKLTSLALNGAPKRAAD